jgi:hypothetical protein
VVFIWFRTDGRTWVLLQLGAWGGPGRIAFDRDVFIFISRGYTDKYGGWEKKVALVGKNNCGFL